MRTHYERFRLSRFSPLVNGSVLLNCDPIFNGRCFGYQNFLSFVSLKSQLKSGIHFDQANTESLRSSIFCWKGVSIAIHQCSLERYPLAHLGEYVHAKEPLNFLHFVENLKGAATNAANVVQTFIEEKES